MEITHIRKLLERYYGGETTLEEEKKLTTFFEQETLPVELKLEQVSFQFYQSAQKEQINRDRLKVNAFQGKSTRIVSMKRLTKVLSIAAAGLVLLVGSYFFTPQSTTDNHITYNEAKDSQLAYLETKKALLLISQKLNKGTQDLDKITKLNEVQNLLTPKN